MRYTDFGSLVRLCEGRSSCRAFSPEPLDHEIIASALRLAQLSPSWSNTQPWNLQVVGGPVLGMLRAEFFARADTETRATPEIPWPREIRGAHLDRKRACGWGLYETLGIAKGDREASGRQARENFRFFGAPHVVLLSCDEALGAHGVMDCGIWLGHFLLACEALGIAAIAQAALAAWPDIWRRHLTLAAEQRIICAVAIGRPDPSAAVNSFRPSRAALDETVTWVI